MTQLISSRMGPCGVYCGACPSYGISCQGCGSENRVNQKRRSKWGCKIRKCCFETKKVEFCNQCDEFPCKTYRKKLTDSHPGDKRFAYRHELIDSLASIKEIGVDDWLVKQEAKWRCPQCGGTIRFYKYACPICSYEKRL